MKCPVCNSIFAASLRDIAVEMGQVRSQKKAEIARQNGARGGRPRKSNEQRTNPDPKAVRTRGHGKQVQR